MDIDQIASEALRLDPEDRALLAETIWESLEDPYVVGLDISDEEAVQLAIQRDEESDKGKVAAITHKEMMGRLRGNES